MKAIKLNTGTSMPVIGFGTWQINSDEAAEKAVSEALKAGYRLIDTAKVYGNERGVGQAIKSSGLAREEMFVTTKLWNDNQGYGTTLKAIDESLEKLGLDYVDLYLIHWPVEGKRQDSWRAMEEIYKSGRAKAVGVSNYTVRHLTELLNANQVVPAVNQVEFHPFIYEEQQELLKFCRNHNIIMEAYSPLASGKRVNDPQITGIAEHYKKTNAQILLRWAIQQGTVPLPRSTKPEHIKQNLAVFDFEINDADMTVLNNLSDGGRVCWDPRQIA